MADMNNEDEKIEPTGSIDPSATTEAVDLNDVSMDKQDVDDIPEKDGRELLTDEAVEQLMDTAELEDSEPAEETGNTAVEDQIWEDFLAEEPEEVAEEEEPESLTDPPEEASVATGQFEEDFLAEEPEEVAEEEEPESLTGPPEEASVATGQFEEDFPAEEPEEVAEEEEPEEAADETDKRSEDGYAFFEEISPPEEEIGRIVNAAKTFSDDTLPDKEHTEIEANKRVKPESTTSQSPSSSSQPARSSKLPTAALLLGILAVVCAVAAGLYSQILKVELDSLRQQVGTTELVPVAAPAESTTGELDRLNTRIEELDARLEEHGQSVKFTEEDWDTVKERIEKIEQSINAMRMSQKPDVSAPLQTTITMAPNLVKSESPPAARKGDWIVNLESHINENDADRLLESYRSKGLPVEKFSVKSGGMTWHRLRVTGFSSAEEAVGYIKSTANQNNFPYAWMERIQ